MLVLSVDEYEVRLSEIYPALSSAGVAMPEKACAEFGGTSGRLCGEKGVPGIGGETCEGGDSLRKLSG